MVFPGGIADIDLGVRQQALEIVTADFQCAGATQGLRSDDTGRWRATESRSRTAGSGPPVVGRGAIDRLVACAAALAFDAGLLSDLDGAEQRNLAVIV